jgi:cytochrome c peroxidase
MRFLCLISLLLLIPIVAWAAGSTIVVDQNHLQFNTAMVKMKVGDHIRFNNSDETSHNILISLGGARTNSGLQKPGEPFEVPMVREGTYQVTCGIHPRMKMVVVVEK